MHSSLASRPITTPTADYVEPDAPWFDPDWLSRQRNFPLAPRVAVEQARAAA